MNTVLLNLRAIRGRAYPRVVGLIREPSWIFWETVLPLLSISAFIYVYRSLNAPPMYEGFVVLGGVMTTYWLNVLWSMAAQLYWEKETANLQLYLAAPMSKMSILAGMAFGAIVSTTLRATAILMLGIFVFNVKFVISSPILLFLVFVVALLALYGMGMLFASLYLMWGREAWYLNNILQEPVYFLSGQYFPVKALGTFVAAAASVIPLTLGLDAMRQILFPESIPWGFLNPWIELALLAVLSVVFIIAAKYALDRIEYLGKVKGTLTMRWQ
ncbi:MAG: ABC transporter permease [Thermoplasmata archaeon]